MVLQKERKVFSDRILSPQAVGTGAVRGTKASLLFIPILTLFSFPAPQTTDQFDLISPFSVDRPTLVLMFLMLICFLRSSTYTYVRPVESIIWSTANADRAILDMTILYCD